MGRSHSYYIRIESFDQHASWARLEGDSHPALGYLASNSQEIPIIMFMLFIRFFYAILVFTSHRESHYGMAQKFPISAPQISSRQIAFSREQLFSSRRRPRRSPLSPPSLLSPLLPPPSPHLGRQPGHCSSCGPRPASTASSPRASTMSASVARRERNGIARMASYPCSR
jgi:hypothetical protein